MNSSNTWQWQIIYKIRKFQTIAILKKQTKTKFPWTRNIKWGSELKLWVCWSWSQGQDLGKNSVHEIWHLLLTTAGSYDVHGTIHLENCKKPGCLLVQRVICKKPQYHHRDPFFWTWCWTRPREMNWSSCKTDTQVGQIVGTTKQEERELIMRELANQNSKTHKEIRP